MVSGRRPGHAGGTIDKLTPFPATPEPDNAEATWNAFYFADVGDSGVALVA